MGLNITNRSFSTNSQTQNRKGSSSCKCVYNGYTLLHGRYLSYCIRPCVKEYSIVQMLLKKTWVGALVMMEWNFAWWSDRLKTWITTCNDHRCGKEIVELVFHQSTMVLKRMLTLTLPRLSFEWQGTHKITIFRSQMPKMLLAFAAGNSTATP